MKKKTVLMSLVLTLALVLGSVSSVFAGYPGIETVPTLKNEVDAETVAMNLVKETKAGGYDLIGTEELYDWIYNQQRDFLLIDTMPGDDTRTKYGVDLDDWYTHRHIPGAINAFAVLGNGKEGNFTSEMKADLLSKVQKAVGPARITKYWNSKKKAWVTKKPAAKYWTKCTKGKYKGKKTIKLINKTKPIVVYCGFVKCTRSDVAAAYLVEKGYKNVYRYPGGISAWKDASFPIEGDDPQ